MFRPFLLFLLVCLGFSQGKDLQHSEIVYPSILFPHGTRRLPLDHVVMSDTISWQIHSWDDLREWPQGFRKGMYWIKVDPHYATQSQCETQVNVPRPADPRGCFLLNHDDPTKRSDYNTTGDLLLFLSNPRYRHYFHSSVKVGIALCFKTNFDVCGDSQEASDWISLVTEFFSHANSIISLLDLNVEFIMDGVGTPGGGTPRSCLNDLWRPWVSTYIYPSDPSNATFSNDPEYGYDRFQVLNEPEENSRDPGGYIDYFASIDYGKFSNTSYPYQFWEPSDQETILEVCDSYLSYPDELHEPGFKFAINIDPVIFQVFTASRSGTAWNYHLSPSAKKPHLAIVPVPTPKILTVFQLEGKIKHQTYEAPYLYGEITASSSASKLDGPSYDSISSLLFLNTSSLEGFLDVLIVGFVEGNSTYSFYNYSLSDSSLQFLSSSEGNSGVTDLSVASVECLGISYLAQVVVNPMSQCQIQWQLFSDNSLLSTVCIWNLSLPDVAVAVGAASMLINETCQIQSLVRVSSKKIIYEAAVQAFVVGNTVSAELIGGPSAVDVGSNPQIAMSFLNNDFLSISVHEEGFCWNSHTANTQANPGLCDQTPESISHQLSYTLSDFDSRVDAINNQKVYTACNDDLLVGTFDQGNLPAVGILDGKGEEGERIVSIVSIHEGTLSQVSIKCGATPTPFDGLVLDAWSIPTTF